MSEIADGALAAITKLLDDELRAETIGGTSIADVLDIVDLEVEFTPVCESSAGYDHRVPAVTEVQKWPNGYAFVYPREHDLRRVSDEIVRECRARFLLLNKWYYRQLRAMSYSMREEVLMKFFPDGVWLPPESSELSKAMGID